MVSRRSGHSSRTLHSATPAPNTPPTSRLSPLLRTLSDMGQAATKLGHGGACVATPKHAPPLRGKLHPTPLPRKNIPKMFIVAGPRPRRAKRPARPSLPTRVSRGSTATTHPAARARDERSPASTEDPVRSVSRPVAPVSNSSFFYPGVLSDSNPNKDRTTGSGGVHQDAGNSIQQPRLSRSPFASLASSLPPDIEETGWGVPLYDEDVVERARTPRTSMDKPPSRRNSIDERHAPARKSLDLSTVRNKIADPPLR